MMDPVFRTITAAEFPKFYDLYRVEMLELHGGCNMSFAEFKAERQAEQAPVLHIQGAFAPDGTLIAYNELFAFRRPPVRPYLYGYVHPEHRGRGIGTRLLAWGIGQARGLFPQVPDDARVVLQSFAAEVTARELLDAHKFVNTRQSWIMHKDLHDELPVQLPTGFQIVTLADHPVLADFAWVHELTFRDHRGHVPEGREVVTERWQSLINGREDYDPTLFMLLRAGDANAGVIIAWPTSETEADRADIAVLGVMPDYRRRGLGEQLLRYMFQTLAARGIHKVGLSVDAASLTGANRLYERVGMHVAHIWHAYELELRPGVELSKQA